MTITEKVDFGINVESIEAVGLTYPQRMAIRDMSAAFRDLARCYKALDAYFGAYDPCHPIEITTSHNVDLGVPDGFAIPPNAMQRVHIDQRDIDDMNTSFRNHGRCYGDLVEVFPDHCVDIETSEEPEHYGLPNGLSITPVNADYTVEEQLQKERLHKIQSGAGLSEWESGVYDHAWVKARTTVSHREWLTDKNDYHEMFEAGQRVLRFIKGRPGCDAKLEDAVIDFKALIDSK